MKDTVHCVGVTKSKASRPPAGPLCRHLHGGVQSSCFVQGENWATWFCLGTQPTWSLFLLSCSLPEAPNFWEGLSPEARVRLDEPGALWFIVGRSKTDGRWFLSVPACWYLPSLTLWSHYELSLSFGLLSKFLSRDHTACLSWQEIGDPWTRTILPDDRHRLGEWCGMQIDGQFGWDLIWPCLHPCLPPCDSRTNLLREQG